MRDKVEGETFFVAAQDNADDSTSPLAAALACKGFSGAYLCPLVVKTVNGPLTVGAVGIFVPCGRGLTNREVVFASRIMAEFGPAMSNAFVHKGLDIRLELMQRLQNVNRELSAIPNPQEVYRQLAESIVAYTGADVCAIRILSNGKRALELKVLAGGNQSIYLPRSIDLENPSAEERIYSEVINSGTPKVWSESADFHLPDWMCALGAKSALLVPVFGGNSVIAVIGTCHRRVKRSIAYDTRLLTSIGAYVGLAIQKSQFFNESRHLSTVMSEALVPLGGYIHPQFMLGSIYEPATNVSGDYFDVFEVDPLHYRVVIADVSAKGMKAAMVALKIKMLIRTFAWQGLAPHETLARLNDTLVRDSHDLFAGEGLIKTASVYDLEVDLEQKTIRAASAGHECFVYWSDTTAPTFSQGGGTIVGCMEGMEYTEEVLPIEEGMKLMLYTDGVREASAGNFEFFGEQRIIGFVDECGCGPNSLGCQELAQELYRRVITFSHGELRDDVSILVVGF